MLPAALRTAIAAATCVIAAVAAPGDEPAPVVVHADADGYFEIDAADAAPAWPGPGVRALVGRFGWLEKGAAAPAVFVRGEEGTYERRALDVRPDDRRGRGVLLAGAIVTDAQARLAAGRASRFDRAIALADPEPVRTAPSLPDAEPLATRRGPPKQGAALAAWAPSGMTFVRFRSVEAALRFADVADRIAGRVLAAAGDGADRGTLRWAIHDLVLPEVWRANPNGEKGCGECAVVVGTWGPGRPEVALLLRVTDPELHRMQTAAGIGFAAMPEHAWKPDDDPDPAARAPRNFRRTIGDVEVVATSRRLLQQVAEPSGAAVQDDPAWTTFRGAAPGASEAFVLFQDSVARRAWRDERIDERRAERGDREILGVRSLLSRWAGAANLVPEGRRGVPAPEFRGPGASLVSIRCTTDAKGADVEATFTDEAAAEDARRVIETAARPLEGGARVCASNRHELFPVARVERDARDLAERCFVVLGWRPVCPCGGTYDAHPVTRDVSCSLHGSDASPLPDPPAPRALVRDVRREGAVVRLRIPIDWR
jgi:hypothetical protein